MARAAHLEGAAVEILRRFGGAWGRCRVTYRGRMVAISDATWRAAAARKRREERAARGRVPSDEYMGRQVR